VKILKLTKLQQSIYSSDQNKLSLHLIKIVLAILQVFMIYFRALHIIYYKD